jgi:phosphoesterase RecJ-like protein
MHNSFRQFNEIVSSKQTFVITTHINPDGDAIGSETALARYLFDKGKTVTIINQSETPENLKFLLDIYRVEQYRPERHDHLLLSAECIIVADANSRNRFEAMRSPFDASGAVKVIIDHHLDHESFASMNIIDTSVPATCELIYTLLHEIDPDAITEPIAVALYTGIMTDTQSFRLPLTAVSTHTIAAALLQKGVQPHEIYQHVYESGAHNTLRLLGFALNSISLHHGDTVAVMMLPRSIFIETQTRESDVDNLTQYVLSIRGVRIGIVITELDDSVKISFRSKGNIPIHTVANQYGGGGHKNAAGARLQKAPLENVKADVLEKISQLITLNALPERS